MSDNERLAAAIVAMYTVTNHDGEWTDTDELIQQAAFTLWAAMTWTAEALALYLWQNGWDAEAAGAFVDISTARVWTVVGNEHHANGAPMTARCAMVGHIAPRSQPARMTVRGQTVEPTREPIVTLTPLGMAVREACAAVLAGELQPCRWCGSIAPCDCERWHEYMLLDADPHGDLSQFSDEEIPY